MDWEIIETNQLAQQDIDRQSIKLLIGNGYIGYRGTLEEFDKTQRTATIVSGLYDKVGNQWREPVNLPNGCFVQVFYQGEPLHVLSSKVVSHSQGLNMKNAVHERRTTFETDDGTQITIRSRRFASLACRHLICMEFSISADRECVIDIHTGIDGDVWDLNGPHLCDVITEKKDGIISLSAITNEDAVSVAVSESVAFSKPIPVDYENHKVQEEIIGDLSIFRNIRVFQTQNGFTFYKYISHVTTRDDPTPLEKSRDFCIEAANLGFDALLAEHAALWYKRWDSCDIQIEGDAAAQQTLRFSLYHLLSIVPAHTEYASIPARGISGQMYKGAIFWDTEIFMLPFFTHAFPDLARKLLQYRYHTLDGARRKAGEYGYRGAFYAWESQDTGDDACSLFNVIDVFTNRPVRTYFRDKQVHISADIPYAFWQYFTASGDDSIWVDGGAEVVFECARFFISYIYFNPDKHRYEVLDVTGPDEYHERVHNNSFTNRLIAHTFEVCLKIAAQLQHNSPEFYSKLICHLDFESDLARITEISNRLYLPDSISSEEIIPQFDGYFSLENIPLQTLMERKLHPNEYLGGGNGLATTTQIIKQADVMLMLYLFSDRYSPKIKTANWEFYEPRTEHGSSLSLCSYSLIASEIGKVEWAYDSFMKTGSIDWVGEGKQYVGTLYIGGTHSASAGGAWMAVVIGLCGIHCSGETISINPHLPRHWEKVTLPFVVRGQMLTITLTHESITVKPAKTLQVPLTISLGDSIYPLHSTGELVIPISTPILGE